MAYRIALVAVLALCTAPLATLSLSTSHYIFSAECTHYMDWQVCVRMAHGSTPTPLCMHHAPDGLAARWIERGQQFACCLPLCPAGM